MTIKCAKMIESLCCTSSKCTNLDGWTRYGHDLNVSLTLHVCRDRHLGSYEQLLGLNGLVRLFPASKITPAKRL